MDSNLNTLKILKSINNLKRYFINTIDTIKGLENLDLSELAKQGDNQEATNTKILEEVQSSSEALQSIVDANILRPNLQGLSFVDGTFTNDVAALIVGGAPNITSINSEEYSGSIRQYAFYGCPSLREANFPLVTSIGNSVFQNCSSLIKLSLGTRLANSLNLNSAYWNPTSAYSATSRSLIPDDVQAEHPLWYNLDYLLYNIRECIAANLPDRTGQTALTITFNATMKGHINNSQETIDAFNNKNWIIA